MRSERWLNSIKVLRMHLQHISGNKLFLTWPVIIKPFILFLRISLVNYITIRHCTVAYWWKKFVFNIQLMNYDFENLDILFSVHKIRSNLLDCLAIFLSISLKFKEAIVYMHLFIRLELCLLFVKVEKILLMLWNFHISL